MIRQRIPIDIKDVLIVECQSSCLDKVVVITVSRSTWMTTKINEVATDLFCTGIIGHPEGMILNWGPQTLI